MNRSATEWFRTAGIIWNIRRSDGSEDTSGVRCGASEGCVAMHGADPEELQAWMVGGEKDSEGVLRRTSAASEGHEQWPILTDIVA